MVFVVGVAAALLLGLGYVVQQRVAATAPLSTMLSFRLLLVLFRRPLWWAGIAAMIAGEVLGGLALQLASVGLVEPLLSTNLLFALAFANLWARRRLSWRGSWHELGGAVLVSAALGVFIAVGRPRGASAPRPSSIDVVLAVVAVGVVVGVLVMLARRRGLRGESVLLAIGAGLLLGLQDTGTRAALTVADRHGAAAMLHDPWLYVVVGAGIVSLVLSQSAFKAARLDYSLPPLAVAEPLAGVLLGVTVLGDVMSVSAAGLAVEALCVVAMIGGVTLIARSPGLAGAHLPGVAARCEQLAERRPVGSRAA